jgi:uncharacterized membrane protein YgcG
MGKPSGPLDEWTALVRNGWLETALWIANRAWRLCGLAWMAVVIGIWVGALKLGWPMAVTLMVSVVAAAIASKWAVSVYADRIRNWPLPRIARQAWMTAYPQFSRRDVDLVERGLRQFFLACLKSRPNAAHMPSRAVDALWHHMILETRSYQRWCAKAAGFFVHHHAAQPLGRDAAVNDALRRTWFWACKEESIDPRQPTRLPLLFALDAKLRFPGGLHYRAAALAAAAATGGDGSSGGGDSDCSYGTDFTNSRYPGGSDDFGGSDSGSGDGGGDGGGCGGGGD